MPKRLPAFNFLEHNINLMLISMQTVEAGQGSFGKSLAAVLALKTRTRPLLALVGTEFDNFIAGTMWATQTHLRVILGVKIQLVNNIAGHV